MTTTRFTLPEPVAPMLASASEPPSGPGWAFEFTWDGVRVIAAAAGDQVRLRVPISYYVFDPLDLGGRRLLP